LLFNSRPRQGAVPASVQEEADRDLNEWVNSMKEAPIKLNNKPKKKVEKTRMKIIETDDADDIPEDQMASDLMKNFVTSKPAAKTSKARKR
jgi:hypothetical protein